jgi:hypothetical protein
MLSQIVELGLVSDHRLLRHFSRFCNIQCLADHVGRRTSAKDDQSELKDDPLVARPSMSAYGPLQTSQARYPLSAFGAKADSKCGRADINRGDHHWIFLLAR